METCKIKNMYRHGDLSFHEIDKLPPNLQEIPHNGIYVAAIGEVTSHSHRILANPPSMKVSKDKDGRVYLSFTEDAEIVHEEHKRLVIKKGLYVISHEREFNYWENSVQRVID